MRLVHFMLSTGKIRLGALDGDNIIDLNSHANWVPIDLVRFLHEHENAYEKLKLVAADPLNTIYPVDRVHLMPPIQGPDKILGIAHNYSDYCDEKQIEYPSEPIVFNRFASTIIGPYDRIKHPTCSKAVEWEVELVVVMGKIARNVKAANAFDYVFGYTAAQDLTATDWMSKSGGQYVLCKNMDHFCPIGPCLVTKDEIPDPHNLFAKTWVNGVLKQNGNTRNLLFKIDELIEHLSSVLTLLPGDLICTGTPSGVGETRSPPEFLKPGDVLTSEIEGVGKLKNYVVDYESHIILKL
ncbi:fumarylacetoacetate hydrolase domain-containing protein 2 [Dendroctonus ponderosae]|uniref:Fumarylacetoacetase-like C-terminal domain-containing protein n=1 Tax=Dendroctonus ponderosae TaxID=77166 RepID=J3JZK0_DENPD